MGFREPGFRHRSGVGAARPTKSDRPELNGSVAEAQLQYQEIGAGVWTEAAPPAGTGRETAQGGTRTTGEWPSRYPTVNPSGGNSPGSSDAEACAPSGDPSRVQRRGALPIRFDPQHQRPKPQRTRADAHLPRRIRHVGSSGSHRSFAASRPKPDCAFRTTRWEARFYPHLRPGPAPRPPRERGRRNRRAIREGRPKPSPPCWPSCPG